jgi:hypothetical protein
MTLAIKPVDIILGCLPFMAAPDGSAWPIKFKTGSKLGVFKKRKEVNDAKKDRSVHEKTRKEVCPRT